MPWLSSWFSKPAVKSQGSFNSIETSTITRCSSSQADIPLPFRLEPLKSVSVYETSVAELQLQYENGTFTAVEYVQYCLERIRKVRRTTEILFAVDIYIIRLIHISKQ